MKLKSVLIFLLSYLIARELLRDSYSNKYMLAILDGSGGNAALIVTAQDKRILINGGQNFDVDARISSVIPFWGLRCRLDLIILTSPRADFVVGLNRLIKRCEVGLILFNEPARSFLEWDLWKKNTAGFNVSKVLSSKAFAFGNLRLLVTPLAKTITTTLEYGSLKVQFANNKDILNFFEHAKIATGIIGESGVIFAIF